MAKMLKSHRRDVPSNHSSRSQNSPPTKLQNGAQIRSIRNGGHPWGHNARLDSVLKNESLFVVHLGSWDCSKDAPVLSMSPETSRRAFSLSHPLSCFSIGVSAIGGTGPNTVVQLPILEDM